MSYCYAQQNGLGGDCNGIVLNGVRYDSPAYAGFTVSASWGEDDFWEVATRYAGEAGGFKVLLGVGYSTQMDETINALPAGVAFVTQKETNKYQQLDGKLSGAGLAAPLQSLNDANFVSLGGLINF